MEVGVLDAVPVDLADVEVGFDFGDVAGGDVVGGAPDAGRGGGVLWRGVSCLVLVFDGWCGRWRAYVVRQCLPVLPRDECHHATGCFGGAAVVFAGIGVNGRSLGIVGGFWRKVEPALERESSPGLLRRVC